MRIYLLYFPPPVRRSLGAPKRRRGTKAKEPETPTTAAIGGAPTSCFVAALPPRIPTASWPHKNSAVISSSSSLRLSPGASYQQCFSSLQSVFAAFRVSLPLFFPEGSGLGSIPLFWIRIYSICFGRGRRWPQSVPDLAGGFFAFFLTALTEST